MTPEDGYDSKSGSARDEKQIQIHDSMLQILHQPLTLLASDYNV